MAEGIKFWATYLLLVAAILAVGWNQPLSYRFMSKKEIAAATGSNGEPTPAPGSWMWDSSKRASKLERGAYGKRSSPGYSYYPYYPNR